jgi:hypothetical protein
MWIVRVALDRPYTFIVLAVLILVLSPIMILRTPTDIFPNIDIPVIAVAWQFTGMNPEELEGRLTAPFERVLTTTVDNIVWCPSKKITTPRQTMFSACERDCLVNTPARPFTSYPRTSSLRC